MRLTMRVQLNITLTRGYLPMIINHYYLDITLTRGCLLTIQKAKSLRSEGILSKTHVLLKSCADCITIGINILLFLERRTDSIQSIESIQLNR